MANNRLNPSTPPGGASRWRVARVVAVATAALLSAGAVIFSAGYAAIAADSVDLGNGYSLDCSGDLPVLSLDREVTVDNEGNTSGSTSVTSVLLNGRTGSSETAGPDPLDLPGTLHRQWTLPNAARYSVDLKIGGGSQHEPLLQVTVPDQCAGWNPNTPEATATNVGIDTADPEAATVSFDYARNPEVPAWTLPTTPSRLRLYIAPAGSEPWAADWSARDTIEITSPGHYDRTFELVPGDNVLWLGAYPISGCGDCGGVDPSIFGTTSFTVQSDEPTPSPTPTPTPTSTVSPTPTASPTAAPAPSARLSTTTTTPGGQLTVSGAGFGADEPLELWLHSTPVRLWSDQADADGAFSQVVTIPAGTEPGAHQIEVRRADGTSVWLDLKVTSTALAATGFASDNTTGITIAAGTLALLGGVALVAVRAMRRRTT